MSTDNDEKWQHWRDAFTSTNSSQDATNANASGNVEEKQIDNALDLAKKRVKEEGVQRLSYFLKILFQEQKTITSHRGTPGVDSSEADSCLVRQIEWHITLLLELWILYGDVVLDSSYPYILNLQESLAKKKKRKRKKKKPSIQASRDEKYFALLAHLTNILSRAAFFLPANVTLGSFLARKCLSRHVWKSMPNVVSHILDQFEVPNPYIAKKDDDDDVPKMLVRKKSVGKKQSTKKKSANLQKERPRLIARKRNRFGGSHFHGKIQDISKLLDKSTTTTPGNRLVRSSSSKSLPKSKLVTPHTTLSNSKTSTSRSNQSKTAASMRDISNANNKKDFSLNEKKGKKRQLKRNSVDAELMSPVPKRRRENSVETPVPTFEGKNTIVAETPSALALDKFISETPIASSTTNEKIVEETPYNKGKIIGETPQPKSINLSSAAVQPVKLFGTLKPRNQLKLKKDPPKSEMSKGRTTNAVVAAARGFLHRNSRF